MLRFIPAFIGLGLAAMWVTALSVDTTTWLTWLDGIAAALCVLAIGVIPERRSSLAAAACLGLIAGGLFVSETCDGDVAVVIGVEITPGGFSGSLGRARRGRSVVRLSPRWRI